MSEAKKAASFDINIAQASELHNRFFDDETGKRRTHKEYADKFGAKYYEGKKPWEVACDVAIPSATQNEIDGSDAQNLLNNK